MTKRNRWPARIALLVSIGMFGAVMGAFEAFGMTGQVIPIPLQTSGSPSASPSASPSPSPSPSCRFAPAPPPVCPSPATSPSPSSSGSPSPSPSPTGGGEVERHDSKVTIRYAAGATPAQFKGAVRSVAKCESKREVVVKRVQEGPNLTVGRDTTSSSGAWSVPEAGAKGRYYAKVLKRRFTQGGTPVVCGAARSETVRV